MPPGACPNCGGPLEFEANLPEGFCASCGIYVEILPRLLPKSRRTREPPPIEPADRVIIHSAKKVELERLCAAQGLRKSGSKDALVARLERYLELREAASAEAAESDSARAIGKRELILFLLSRDLPRPVAETVGSIFGTLATFRTAKPADIDLVPGISPPNAKKLEEAIAQTRAPPPPPEEVPAPPEEIPEPPPVSAPERPPSPPVSAPERPPSPPVSAPERPPSPPVSAPELPPSPPVSAPELPPSPPVSAPELPPFPPEVAETQPIRLEIAPPAVEPPEFLSPDDDRIFELEFESEAKPPPGPVAEGAENAAPAAEATVVESAPAHSASRLRRDRWLLYTGTALQAIGGAGFILGSLLHDVFRVPWFGENFGAFGSLNAGFSLLGVILLMIGLGAIGLSLRGGIAKSGPAAEG